MIVNLWSVFGEEHANVFPMTCNSKSRPALS